MDFVLENKGEVKAFPYDHAKAILTLQMKLGGNWQLVSKTHYFDKEVKEIVKIKKKKDDN